MSEFQLIHPQGWQDYELIDSGRNEKLERFGPYIVWRPEPQACWNKAMIDDQSANLPSLLVRRHRKARIIEKVDPDASKYLKAEKSKKQSEKYLANLHARESRPTSLFCRTVRHGFFHETDGIPRLPVGQAMNV